MSVYQSLPPSSDPFLLSLGACTFLQARINAVHKQATLGDCTEADWSTPFEKTVLRMWRSYKGTPALTAKRRFLGLLRDVDPRLLHVKAYHFSPWGFPTTPKGERICPYSNSRKGCPRPIMDKYGHNLEHELENNESLAEFVNLKKWLDEVGAQQRCALGLHARISAQMGAKFSTFFSRPECGGFQQYAPKTIHNMVKKVCISVGEGHQERVNIVPRFTWQMVLSDERRASHLAYCSVLTKCMCI